MVDWETKDGLSWLEVKNQMLMGYLIDTNHVVYNKLKGKAFDFYHPDRSAPPSYSSLTVSLKSQANQSRPVLTWNVWSSIELF